MTTFSPSQRQTFATIVVDAFTPDELSQLSRNRLGKPLNALVNASRGLIDVVPDLIDFVERQGWTEELVRGVYEERKDNPTVLQFCQVEAKFVFQPRTTTNELARAVGAGLSVVVGRFEPASALRAVLVGNAAQTLADLGTQFSRLRKYKILHDCLHNLQFKYARGITTELRLFRDDPVGAADTLVAYFREMADELIQARPEIEGLESTGAEKMWLNVADESVRRMETAILQKKTDDAAKGFQLLDGVLRVQPTRINELLTGLLERLPLDPLRDTLTALAQPLGTEGAPLAEAAAALGNLTPRLNGILSDHKEWQLVDNSLHQIDTELRIGSALEQCSFLWSEVDKILGPILDRDRTGAWSQELRKLGKEFSDSFTTTNPEQVRGAFKRLHPRAMWYFFQADKDLKELSGELDEVGNKLRDILTEVGT